MVSPSVQLPVMAGVLSLVSGAPATVGAVGVLGAVVSTVTVVAGLAGDVFPAGSVAVVVTLWLPSGIAVVGVIENVPPLHVAVGAISVPSTCAVIVSPSVQLPVMAGVLSLVSGAPATVGAVGAAGGVVSTVTGPNGPCGLGPVPKVS